MATLGLAVAAFAPRSAPAARPVSLTGSFVVVHADARRPILGNDVLAFLDVNGHLYKLHGVDPHQFRPQTRLSVAGVLGGNDVSAASVSTLATPSAPPPATGTQTLLAINVVWGAQTLAATQPTATAFLFGTTDPAHRSLRQYYQDVSHGQLDWTGTVTPTLTIPDPGSCSLDTIANAADAAATNAGYVLSNYGHRMYNFPSQYCGSGGWGEVGGTRSWIVDGLWNLGDGYGRMVPTHELGHNLGLWHGHGLACGAALPSTTCISAATGRRCDDGWAAPCVSEYGFSFDLMGNNWTSDPYDAVNSLALDEQIHLGWLNGRTSNDTNPGTPANHTFQIGPIESATGNVGLVIASGSRNYYVEYRQPLGQDAFLTNWPDATSGVLISSDDNIDYDSSALGTPGPLGFDTSPGSCTSDTYCDWHDAALNIGQSFSDVAGHFTLTVNSTSSSGASVTVHWLDDTTKPTIKRAPQPKFTTHISTATIPVTVSWSASDSSGICGYALTQSADNGGPTPVALASSTSTSATPDELPGHSYVYAVQAKDCSPSANATAFVAGPAWTPAKDEETSAAITYTGTWAAQSVRGASGGGVMTSSAAGNAAQYTCSCRDVGVVTSQGPGAGTIQVYLDGLLTATVPLASSTASTKKVVYKAAFASVGPHTLEIVSADANPVQLDAFVNLH